MQSFALRTLIATSPLRHSDKKSLVRREAVHRGEALFLGRVLPCQVGEQCSAKISNIFTGRELAVDANVVDHNILRILIADTVHPLFESFGVLRGPPVLEIASRIELTPLLLAPVG